MNFHGILLSLNNGEGVRAVLWVAGCNHHCDGCHNKYTWDADNGIRFTKNDSLKRLINYVNKPYVDGLTLSGGDPMYPANRRMIVDIARNVKRETKKSIWMYTGYLWEQIKDEPVMQYIDVVVDGEYKKELPSDKYVGSNNQRIIDVQKSLQTGGVVLWD